MANEFITFLGIASAILAIVSVFLVVNVVRAHRQFMTALNHVETRREISEVEDEVVRRILLGHELSAEPPPNKLLDRPNAGQATKVVSMMGRARSGLQNAR
jgi:hypothetical protein